MSEDRYKKAYDTVQEIKRLVKYLDENVSANLPTYAVQTVCSRVSLLAINLEELSVDQDYVDTWVSENREEIHKQKQILKFYNINNQ